MKKILFLLVFACTAQLFAQSLSPVGTFIRQAAGIIVESNQIYREAVKEKKEYVSETFSSPGATSMAVF